MPDITPQMLSAIALIWSIGNTIALWLRKPGVEAQVAVERLRDECHMCRREQADQVARLREAEERRLTEIETHLEHMPSSEELSRLDAAIREVAARTAGMHDRVGTMAQQLTRIEDYLLCHPHHGGGA